MFHTKIWANLLFETFAERFSALYGRENETYNLHAHLHLASQVAFFGPLHKLSCFPFEGAIRICKMQVHGSRGYGSQVNDFVSLDRYLLDDNESYENVLLQNLFNGSKQESNKNKVAFLKQISNLTNKTLQKCLLQQGFKEKDSLEILKKFSLNNISIKIFYSVF